MEKKLINEEISKIKLLMGYDNSKTLNENVSNTLVNDNTQVLSEQTGKSILKSLFGFSDDAAIQAAKAAGTAEYTAAKSLFDDVISEVGKIVDNKTTYSTGDEIIKGLSSGAIRSSQALGKIAKGLLRTGKVTGNLRKILINRAGKIGSTTDEYIKLIDDDINKSVTRIKNRLIKKGYPTDIAEDIAKKTVEYVKGGATTAGRISRTASRTASRSSNAFNKIKSSFGEKWSKLSLKQKFLAILAAGGGILVLIGFLQSEEPELYPDCLLEKMSDEDVKKMSGLDYILISKTGVRQLDISGGIKVFANKNCESADGKFEGSWDDGGSVINVELGGRKFSIPCGGSLGSGAGSEESSYVECPNEPFQMYCKNDRYIKQLQECLNKLGNNLKVDGYFGPKTLEALQKVSGYESVTENTQIKVSDITKICEQSNVESNTTQTSTNNAVRKPRIGTLDINPEGE
jgi:hypothetical protein